MRHVRGQRVASLVAGTLLAGLVLAGCAASPPGCGNQPDGAGCLRVLFVGNSYTYVNDLPTTLAWLAVSGGHRIETGAAAVGGATLADHVRSSATQQELQSRRWDVVVLQEQSQIPADARAREAATVPAARTLAAAIVARGARPLLFETWAHRDGWPEDGLPTYATMQAAIDDGYQALGQALGVRVAAVGSAWSRVRREDPSIALWESDGSHPSVAGTYLAACVFYAALFEASPVGLGFRDGLPAATAATLQRAAASS